MHMQMQCILLEVNSLSIFWILSIFEFSFHSEKKKIRISNGIIFLLAVMMYVGYHWFI